MIGGITDGAVGDDAARGDAAEERLRDEQVIQPDVRPPRGECEADEIRLEVPESVAIACIEHLLNRPPADLPATEPDEGTKPGRQLANVQQLPRRERVEVANEHVRPALMLLDRHEQRAQLVPPAALGPRRVHGAEVEAKYPPAHASGDDLSLIHI